VATKKIEPNTLSYRVNIAELYSFFCNRVKYAPSMIVVVIAVKASLLLVTVCGLEIKHLCASVTVAPEESRTIVLSRGTLNGFKVTNPAGGQQAPIWMSGANLLW
jgi:hypothetical protein